MANEFKVKNGLIVTGDTLAEGSLHLQSSAPLIRIEDTSSNDNHYFIGNNGQLRVQSTGTIQFRANQIDTLLLDNNQKATFYGETLFEGWMDVGVVTFRNSESGSNPTYPNTGFYQWGDEWQVNARTASNSFVHNVFKINNATKKANFYGDVETNSEIIVNNNDAVIKSGNNDNITLWSPDTGGFARLRANNNYIQVGPFDSFTPNDFGIGLNTRPDYRLHIDNANQTNTPAIRIVNVGAGTSGISLVYGSGSTILGATSGGRYKNAYTNIGGVENAIGGSIGSIADDGAYRIVADPNASNNFESVLSVKALAETKLITGKQLDGTNVFEVDYNGDVTATNFIGDGSLLTNIVVPDDSITEPKLSPQVRTKLNAVVGSGGYAANIYYSNIDSTIVTGYKQLSYEDDATATIIDTIVNNNEVLIDEFISDAEVIASKLPSGVWAFNSYTKVSSSVGVTKLRFEVFKRTSANVETVLFSLDTIDLNNNTFEMIQTQSSKPSYEIDPTDRLGVKVYANTTRNGNVTVSFEIGNGNASYVNSPLQIRHSQLRGTGDDDLHPINAIEGLQSELNGKEDSFTKNTAFNKNFGTASDTVAEGNDSRITNGQTAFSWGDHSTEGYLTSFTDTYANGVSFDANTGDLSLDMVIDTGGPTSSNYFLDTNLDGRYVDLTTNQSISGEKTFNDNLGINTSTPRTKLHAVGDNPSSLPSLGTAGSAASIGQFSYGTQFSTLSNGKGYIQQSRTDGSTSVYDLLLQPQGGNVGIGGDNPAEKLTIIDGGIILGTSTTNQPNTSYIRFTEYDTDNIQGSFMHYDGSANLLHLGMHPTSDNVVGNDINAITIRRDNRNVGIGTTNPSSKLEVNGDIEVNSNNYFKAGDTWIRDNGAGISVISQNDLGGGSIFFRPNGDSSSVNEMTLDSSGNLVVDGTADFMFRSNTYYGNAANNPMIYFGASTNSNAIIHRASGTNQNFNWRSSSNTTVARLNSDNGRLRLGDNINPTYQLEVDGDVEIDNGGLGVNVAPSAVNGRIQASEDIIAYASDERLKNNKEVISSPIEKVKKLEGFTYNWNELAKKKAGYTTTQRQVGVSAQSLKEVIPEAVKLAPFDNDGKDNSISGEDYLTVQYDKITPLLIEAIKEQDEVINSQQKQLDSLQEQINELKKLI